MSESQISPLQDALEHLRQQWRDVPVRVFSSLHAEAPSLAAAIELVLARADGEVAVTSDLEAEEMQPDLIDDINLIVNTPDFDTMPPRKIKDVWSGKGDYDDPAEPVMARLDLSWPSSISTAPEKIDWRDDL